MVQLIQPGLQGLRADGTREPDRWVAEITISRDDVTWTWRTGDSSMAITA